MKALILLLSALAPSQQIPVDPVFAVCVVNERLSPTVFFGSAEMCLYSANSVLVYPYGDGTGYLNMPAGPYTYGYSRMVIRFPFDNFPPSNTPVAPTYFANEQIPVVFDMVFRNGME